MTFLDRVSRLLNHILLVIAGLFLTAMIVITCANIFLRIVWAPVVGTFELMGFFGALATALAMGYTQMQRGHIAVDIFIQRFSERTRRILAGVNYIISMFFYIIAGWQITRWAMVLKEEGELTETLRIIFYPFVIGVAFGCFVISLAFLVDLLKTISHTEELPI
ncbi:TRAP transporter small permease [Thermodesulfobacteriota bacterium]